MKAAALALLALASASVPSAAETMARGTFGFANVFDTHIALGASARIRLGGVFFAEPEFLVLQADDHADVGPVFHFGIVGGPARAQVALALGYGPVQGKNNDDGLGCLSLSVALRVREAGRVWIIPETRIGILGETGYFQTAIGVGYRFGSN